MTDVVLDHDKNLAVQLANTAIAKLPEGHTLNADTIVQMVSQIYRGLAVLKEGNSLTVQKPAVPVEQSITDDYLVCLEDGKKLKMLKRHLRTSFGMTPEEYRQKWGLSIDYPMVAANYAAKRSQLAKDFGLGTNRLK